MTNGLRFLSLGILLFTTGFPTPLVHASTPGALWVAPLGPGQSAQAARDAGARIRDAFPEALGF